MGRTGGSLDCAFPPQGGGRSPRRVDPLVGSKTERPLEVVIVVVECYCFLIIIIVGTPPPRRSDPSRRFCPECSFCLSKTTGPKSSAFVVVPRSATFLASKMLCLLYPNAHRGHKPKGFFMILSLCVAEMLPLLYPHAYRLDLRPRNSSISP